jgi:hypothetical protein
VIRRRRISGGRPWLDSAIPDVDREKNMFDCRRADEKRHLFDGVRNRAADSDLAEVPKMLSAKAKLSIRFEQDSCDSEMPKMMASFRDEHYFVTKTHRKSCLNLTEMHLQPNKHLKLIQK